MLYRFHFRCDLGHVPEHRSQTAYPVSVQCGHIHAIVCSCGFCGKHGQHLRPVRGLSVDLDAVIVPGLQFFQLCIIGDIHLRYSLCHRHGIGSIALRGEKQAEG